MAVLNKIRNIDFEIFFTDIKDYFSNLSQYALYSWIAIGLGVILIIISFVV
jgi:heme exporter protein D